MIQSTTKPSLLFVVHSLVLGGTENLVYQISKELQHKYRIGICCLDKKGPLWELCEKENIELFLIEREAGFNIATILNLKKVFQQFQPQIIHSHQYSPFFYSALAELFLLSSGRLIFTEHGRHFPDIVSSKRRACNIILRKLATRVTAVSEFTKKSLVEQEGFQDKNIEVLYNGISIDQNSTSVDIRDALGLSKKAKVLAVVGSLREVKNPLFPLRGFLKIAEEFQDTHLVYIGDGELREELESNIRKVGLEGRVLLAGNLLPARPYFSSFNGFIMGSLSEACSLALLEAMIAEVPVIVSNRGGSPELVAHGEYGQVVDCDDDIALENAMRKILIDEESVVHKGLAAANFVRDQFSFAHMCERYDRIYQEFLC